MRQNQLHNIGYLKSRRRELRSNLTPAEAKLWKALKNGGIQNRKFRRQHSIGNYIVDFYCPTEKLIIELDGEVHNDPMRSQFDFERGTKLQQLGFTILRFENKLVFSDLTGVINSIERAFRPD